jgi:hypothetical protein
MEWLDFGKDIPLMAGLALICVVFFAAYFIFGNPSNKLE